MTLQQFRYLLALDEHRHFGRAAAACFVAQPTLTLQLKKLENELDVQLFDRSAYPITPTPLGRKVIEQARNVLNEVNNLETLLREETADMSGIFNVGIIPTLAPYLLPLFLRPFSEAFPDISLRFRELQSEEIISELSNGGLDIGLLVTPLEEKQLREIVLFYEPFLIFASPGEDILKHAPLLPDHVHRKDLWILEQGHCFRNQVLNICGNEDASGANRSNISFAAGSVETLKNMVRNNPGYTIIPELSVQSAADQDLIKRFGEPQPAREVSMVVNRHFSRERLLEELRQTILTVIPDRFKKNERYLSVGWRNE
jgi:LysR family hydrogen peroxide-inducible transcriptional activator